MPCGCTSKREIVVRKPPLYQWNKRDPLTVIGAVSNRRYMWQFRDVRPVCEMDEPQIARIVGMRRR